MKHLFLMGLTAFGLAVALPAIAQEEEAKTELDPTVWTVNSDLGLTLTQNAYSASWVGGDAGSMSWTLNSHTTAEKQIFARIFNQNTLKLQYGLTYTQEPGTSNWSRGEKSTDLIDLESTYRITTGTAVEPIIAFRGITQFRDLSEIGNERWLNPLDLTESIGIARVFIKEETREWQTRIGVAAKQFINRDAFLDPAQGTKETLTESSYGFELVNDLKQPLADGKIVWTSKLTLFQGVFSSLKDDLADTNDPNAYRYPDINFENTFAAQVTKLIAVNLYVQMLYDRQIDLAARFKQTLAVGLTYKLL